MASINTNGTAACYMKQSMEIYKTLHIIDDLQVYLIPVRDITEKDHGYEGQDILYGSEREYYITVLISIKAIGIQSPLVLYFDKGQLKICDGWHRWKLAIECGLTHVPAVIFNSLGECIPTTNIRW